MEISVFVLTKDRCDKLIETIKSVQKQTVKPKEIVVVDNGSSDETSEMVNKLFPEIHLIRLHKNFGIITGRNIGIKNCKGEIIFFFDDDAELLNDYTFSKVLNLFKSKQEIGVVTLNIKDLKNTLKFNNKEDYIETVSFSGGVSFIRKELFNEVGMFDDQFYTRAEENDFSLRLLNLGYSVIALPSIKVLHKVLPKRETNIAKYYSFRNKSIILLRYFPIKYILIEFTWHFLNNLINSIKTGWILLFIKGLYEVVFKVKIERKLISNRCLLKYLQLKSHEYSTNNSTGFFSYLKSKFINYITEFIQKEKDV